MTKFKVGDLVIITDDCFSRYQGKIYKVVRADKHAYINLFREDSEDAMEDYWLRHLTPLEKLL